MRNPQPKVRPRMPDTPERSALERKRSIREVVFGAQDGVLTTLGIVTGVGTAQPERTTILLTGIVALLVGALSMGVGQYLGGKSEREVVQNAITKERSEMEEKPAEEFAEQVAYYRLKGFTAQEAEMIVRRLTKNPDVWLHEMVRDEFGVDPRIAENAGLRPTFSMAASFATGALLPILPYLIPIPHPTAVAVGLVLSALALFGIGFYAGKLAGRNPLAKGAEIVMFGAGVFLVSYLAGRLIPALFGHPPVPAGG